MNLLHLWILYLLTAKSTQMKNRKKFPFLSGCGKVFSALSWTHKCECSLEIFYACGCLCTEIPLETGEEGWNFVLVGGTARAIPT